MNATAAATGSAEPRRPGRPRGDTRERLLAAAVDHVARHGVGDATLRSIAEAIGTSHRMLVFHFGSKEGLLLEVVRAVEARERERLGSLPIDSSAPPVEQMWAWWQHLADPAQWPHERLFFELYAQALQGRPHARPLLDEAISAWLRPMTAVAIAFGTPPAEAEAEARLGIAVTRGLLLDLLATGDRAGVDAAMRRYQALFSALRPSAPSRGTGRPRPAAPTNDRTAQRPRT